MKKILLLITSLSILAFSAQAQAPEAINYQAVARDASGSLIKNANLIVKITVLSGAGGVNQEYQESHGASTNDYGLFSLQIGKGAPLSGTFANVNWGSDDHYVKVEVDNGGGFIDMGKTQMMSVPYALNAKSVSGMNLNDLANVNAGSPSTNQVLSWDGSNWVPVTGTGGSSYTGGTGINISGTVITNSSPDQTVSLSGNGATSVSGTYPNFSISSTNTTYTGGTGLTLSGTTFNAQTTTALWNANKLRGRTVATTMPSTNQVLTWTGSQWAPQAVSGGSSAWIVSGSNVYRNTGKVGVGLTNPVYKLDIAHTPGNATNNRALNIAMTGYTSSATNSFGLRSVIVGNGSLNNFAVFGEANGTADVTNGSNIGGRFVATATTADNAFGLRASATDGASTRNYGIYGESDGVSGQFNIAGIFFADGGGVGSANDNYGIYCSGENAGTGTAYSIYAAATTNTDYAGYFNGNLAYNGTLTNVSDMRLKENIKEYNDCLGLVNSIKIYTYNYSAKGDYASLNLAEGKQYGFLAQDLEKYFPELVKENNVPNIKGIKDGEKVEKVDATYKSVNHVGMIPILTRAIQEQQELIERLEKRITELEKK